MSEAKSTRRQDRQYTPEDLSYPEQLPVTGERQRILAALRDHQVVVIAGETGSGKTTQLPKMLLELGLHRHGLVGHTQPRRLAARTVAERLAEEMGTSVGADVGYQVRFTAETSASTAVKLMTDGILLAEIQRDPLLKRYSAIIIDEAHERSLNIDVILGYLKRILPQRPDLKVIVTSATIDPQRFARHFSAEEPLGEELPDGASRDSDHLAPDSSGGERTVPILEVSGRTYPVEIRYRPVNPEGEIGQQDEFDQTRPARSSGGEERDLMDAVVDAVLELAEEPDGDILVFFPGEREIREAAEALNGLTQRHRKVADTEILPLFGRLSMAEQRRVFSPGGRRRIVLATNVAETSLTVPGIKYVVDTGTARISRYSTRSKVQRLPIEPISQASANQRSGRSGRTSAGIAIRLYSQQDFETRPEFTDPEILRTSLASVLLQMSSMGITKTPDDLLRFPFVQKPDAKAVNDAVRLLTELGALERSGAVTATGRTLAQLPVDPRLGRMMVEAGRRSCLAEITVLTAALSIQDPRERPSGEENAAARQQADELHGRFTDENSDFSALLNLWRYLQQKQAELSGNQFRRMCRREFLHYMRIREWQDLVVQLTELAGQAEIDRGRTNRASGQRGRGSSRKGLKRMVDVDPVGRHEAVHKSLLAGLLSHIGLYNPRTRDYQGARGTRFAVFPGSGLFKKKHDWIMAAELVETSRLWARTVARIEPAWAEELAAHLVKTSYGEPHWSTKKGAAVTTQRVTLFGVPVVAERPVLYAGVDRELSRDLFIRRALVEGRWQTRHHFDERNRRRFEELEKLQNRTRRKDLVASDDELFAFFDERVPEEAVSQRHFDAWWKVQRHRTPELLDLSDEHLLADSADDVDVDAFPEHFDHDGLELELRYEFNPVRYRSEDPQLGRSGESPRTDGVTVLVPVLFLNQLQPDRFDWLIPGLRTEMITHLIRSMPKQLRKNFVPAPDVAAAARTQLEDEFTAGVDPFRESLATVLRRQRGVVVDPADLDLSALPEHLRVTFAVLGDHEDVLDAGFDLGELQLKFSAENRAAVAQSVTASSGTGYSQQDAQNRPSTDQDPPDDGGRRSGPAAAADITPHSAVSSRRNQTSWTFGDVPDEISTQVSGHEVTGYPALSPDDAGVHVTVVQSRPEQVRIHRIGVVTLLREVLPSPQRYVVEHLSNRERLAFSQFGEVDDLVAESTTAALDHLVPAELPFTAAEFESICRSARAELIETVLKLTDVVARVLTLNTQVRSRLGSVRSAALAPAVSDMQAQIDQLVRPGFITATGLRQLQHLPRYLQAMEIRLDRLEAGQSVGKDTTDMQQIQQVEDEYDAAVETVPEQLPVPAELAAVKWMIEELRVNLFAQQLGTAETVSAKRVRRAVKQAPRH